MTDRDKGPTPTVSRVLPDGRLVELLYDPERRVTALAVGGPDGEAVLHETFDLADGERLVPYAADNNLIATGCVLLPSEVGMPFVIRCESVFGVRATELFPDLFEENHDVVMRQAVHLDLQVRGRTDAGSARKRALLLEMVSRTPNPDIV